MKRQLSILFVLLPLCSAIPPAIAGNIDPSIQSETKEIKKNGSKSDGYPLGIIGSVAVAIIGLFGGII